MAVVTATFVAVGLVVGVADGLESGLSPDEFVVAVREDLSFYFALDDAVASQRHRSFQQKISRDGRLGVEAPTIKGQRLFWN